MKRTFSEMTQGDVQQDYVSQAVYSDFLQSDANGPFYLDNVLAQSNSYIPEEKMDFNYDQVEIDTDTGSAMQSHDDSSEHFDYAYEGAYVAKEQAASASAPTGVNIHDLKLVKCDGMRSEVELASRNVLSSIENGVGSASFSKPASMVLEHIEEITGRVVTRAFEVELLLSQNEIFAARTTVRIGSLAERVLEQRLFGQAQKSLDEKEKARHLLTNRSASFMCDGLEWRLVQTKDCNARKIRAPLVLLVGLTTRPPVIVNIPALPQVQVPVPQQNPLYQLVDELVKVRGDRAVFADLQRLLIQTSCYPTV
jgi:hypothetical protein